MTYRLPVVSTPVGGIPEAVRDGDSGFLVEPGDVSAMAAALERLLADPELRLQMGARGQTIVKEQFEVTAILGNLYRLYRAVHTRTEYGQDT
jgi:glycosyltransferase involved in cell wall biosynthesis